MVTRRDFLKSAAFLGAAMFIPTGLNRWTRILASSGPTLDPKTITKYANTLAIPPVMPRIAALTGKSGETIDYYEITLRQIQQQILPSGSPATTVWGYGSAAYPSTFFYPANTIEATANVPVRVKWINGLVDGSGRYLRICLPSTRHCTGPTRPAHAMRSLPSRRPPTPTPVPCRW